MRKNFKIFSPGTIAGLSIQNRLIRSATNESAMGKNGKITNKMINLYKNLALGGTGAIITGHMAVAESGRAYKRQTRIYDDKFINEIKPIAETVHNNNSSCIVFAQLSHTGRQVNHDNSMSEAVGPSEMASPVLKKKARALSKDEIKDIINCFVRGAVRAQEAGFDGVQLHAAHGWLLSSFLSPCTNRREDEYGGSVKNRVRIIKEIISGIRSHAGKFPVLVKMNCDDFLPGGIGIDTFSEIAVEVEKAGAHAIEVSGGMWDCLDRSEEELGFKPVPIPEARTNIQAPDKQSYFYRYAKRLNLKIPVILLGGNRNIERMEKIIKEGSIDFFSMARPFINDPGLTNRWLSGNGSSSVGCISCNSCLLTAKHSSLQCIHKNKRFIQKLYARYSPGLWRLIFK